MTDHILVAKVWGQMTNAGRLIPGSSRLDSQFNELMYSGDVPDAFTCNGLKSKS